MNVSIIQLICNIVMFVCVLFVSFRNKELRNYISELKGDIADEKFIRQTLINQQEKKIKTLCIRHCKPFEYAIGNPRPFSSERVKHYMAECLAQQIIKDNILQIKEFDSYYEGRVDFVKSETNSEVKE